MTRCKEYQNHVPLRVNDLDYRNISNEKCLLMTILLLSGFSRLKNSHEVQIKLNTIRIFHSEISKNAIQLKLNVNRFQFKYI